MIEGIARAIIEGLLQLLVAVVLWPVAMVICAPLVLLRAAFLAATRRQRLRFAVRFGFYAVSDFWESIAFL